MAYSFDTDLYRTFVAVVECGGFTAAASRLRRTQATVSQQIKRLEGFMKRPLLKRTSRSVELTPAGEALLPFARHILALHERAAESVIGSYREPLRLGVPDLYADTALPIFLDVLAQHTRGLAPVVRCDQSTELFEHFCRGELDIILIARYPNFPPGHRISYEPLIWVGSPTFSHTSDNPLPLALYPEGCPFRARALAALEYAEIPWEVVYTGQSGAALHVPLSLNMGITVMSRRTLSADMRDLGTALGLPPIKSAMLDLHLSAPVTERFGSAALQPLTQAISSAFLFSNLN